MRKQIAVPVVSVLVIGCVALGVLFMKETRAVEAANSQIADMSNTISDLSDIVTALDADVSKLDAKVADLEVDKAALLGQIVTVQSQLAEATAALMLAESRIESLSSDLRAAESRYTSMKAGYESSKTELAELKTFYDGIFKGEAPPWMRTDGNAHNVVDNESAADVTWGELVSFLRNDQTDRRRYVAGEYDCSEFAEDLHNSAEAAGIRSAMVFLAFEDSEVGHALNAFNTADRGLVFIDNTGSPRVAGQSWDRVAYILVGERYGALKLDANLPSFEYDHYADFREQYERRMDSYEARVLAHNANVQSYNAAVQSFDAAVDAYNQNPTSAEYLRLVAWQAELDAWRQQIDASYASLSLEFLQLGFQRDSLGGILGTVSSVEMYW